MWLAAIRAKGTLDSSQQVDQLIRLIKHESVNVRVQALGQLKTVLQKLWALSPLNMVFGKLQRVVRALLQLSQVSLYLGAH